MNSRAVQKYKRYYEWWEAVEKLIFRLAVLLFLMLFAVHFVNFILSQRGVLFLNSSVNQLEGIAVAESQTQINTGSIELSVASNSDYSKLQIYINGEYLRSFDERRIILTVKNNDVIEISGIKSEYPAIVKITSASANIILPKQGEAIKINKNFVKACRIRLK